MKILIVANYNKGYFVPFIMEQIKSLQNQGVETECFGIIGKGIIGYLKNRGKLINKIKEFKPDIIHAHYGLSGLLANLQRKIPVVTTYHGSDINNDNVFLFSKICIKLSTFNIFVSEKNRAKAQQTKKQAVIPCGVNIDLFLPENKIEAREKTKFQESEKLILFAGAFDNKVKNYQLAFEATQQLENIKLIELKNYSRQEVANLMNAVDCSLLTSFTEGSPQFIKEAMACNCPIVSVDVGDVKDVIKNIEGCFICPYDSTELANKLKLVLNVNERTKGRERILELGLDLNSIAKGLLEIYKNILTGTN